MRFVKKKNGGYEVSPQASLAGRALDSSGSRIPGDFSTPGEFPKDPASRNSQENPGLDISTVGM